MSKKKTILLVDDDTDFLYQQQALLEEGGYNVVTAENEKQAEDIFTKKMPDAAIIDPMLTHADGGFVLSYKIKKKSPKTPIILVSSMNDTLGMSFGVSTEEEREWIKADAFLSKPIRFEQLHQELGKLM